MSWLQKLLPPKIKRGDTSARNKSIPEGLWSKCEGCESVLYRSDLEGNLSVCPKCGHHHRVGARRRLDLMLDAEGRVEIGAEVTPVDALKFKDSRKYPERLSAATADTGEADAMVVMSGRSRAFRWSWPASSSNSSADRWVRSWASASCAAPRRPSSSAFPSSA